MKSGSLRGLAIEGVEDDGHGVGVAIHGLCDTILLGGGEGRGRLVHALGEAFFGEGLDELLELLRLQLLAGVAEGGCVVVHVLL